MFLHSTIGGELNLSPKSLNNTEKFQNFYLEQYILFKYRCQFFFKQQKYLLSFIPRNTPVSFSNVQFFQSYEFRKSWNLEYVKRPVRDKRNIKLK